jgi:hypothetical protein
VTMTRMECLSVRKSVGRICRCMWLSKLSAVCRIRSFTTVGSMGNGFAGAKDAGDRRRRRLSHDEHDQQLFDDFFPAEPGRDSASTVFADAFPNSSQLLRRFVSPRLWKHVCVLLGVFSAVLAVIWWERAATSSGVERAEFPVEGATGLLLLLSGQFAFFIGWIRSHSTLDFRGRYRWWKWLGAGAVCAGITMLTGTDVIIPDAIVGIITLVTGPVQAARPAVVLVPALLFCLVVLGQVIPDMSRNVWSQGALVTALLVMTVRLMLIHTSSRSVIDQATLNQMLLLSVNFGFAAMLLHCRFVAFVNNDPPATAEQIRPTSQCTTAVAEAPELEAPDIIVANISLEDKTGQPLRQKQAAKKKTPRGRKAA